MNESAQAAPDASVSLLPTAAKQPVKQGRRPRILPSDVLPFTPRQMTPAPLSVPTSLDEVTRNLHAAASAALRMIELTRRDAGLPSL
ncbi:hypothetical protein [Pseudoxanthomonas mexicana]